MIGGSRARSVKTVASTSTNQDKKRTVLRPFEALSGSRSPRHPLDLPARRQCYGVDRWTGTGIQPIGLLFLEGTFPPSPFPLSQRFNSRIVPASLLGDHPRHPPDSRESRCPTTFSATPLAHSRSLSLSLSLSLAAIKCEKKFQRRPRSRRRKEGRRSS